jgi:hypothetical protein
MHARAALLHLEHLGHQSVMLSFLREDRRGHAIIGDQDTQRASSR